MKNGYRYFINIFYLFACCVSVSAQLSFYDSVNTVVFSDTFEYKNPVFDNRKYGLGQNHWLVYERHYNGFSDIIVRSAYYNTYGSEIVITNPQNSLNLNPTLSNNFIVWQSNERGNWDLYCSAFTNESYWSSPVLIKRRWIFRSEKNGFVEISNK